MAHKNIQQHLEPFDQLGRAPGATRESLDQIADAGNHADGTPLLAIYVSEAACPGTDLGTNDMLMNGVRK